MKNTKNKGNLRFMIYGSEGKYIGVCFELGIVEEEKNLEKLMYRIRNGTEAVVKAVKENNLDAKHLNKNVGLKYEMMWYLGWVIQFKKGYKLKVLKPIENFNNQANLAPSCL